MKKILFAVTLFLLVVSVNSKVYSHCQIPCGIYDDKMRIEQIKEHEINPIGRNAHDTIGMNFNSGHNS